MPPFFVLGRAEVGLMGEDGPLLFAPAPPLFPDRTLTFELLLDMAGLLFPEAFVSVGRVFFPLSWFSLVVGFNSLSAFNRLPALPVLFEGPKPVEPPTACIRPAECVRFTLELTPSDDGGRALIVPDLLFRPLDELREMLDVGE